MLGRKFRDQLEVFVVGSLEELVLDDHVLARVTAFWISARLERKSWSLSRQQRAAFV